MMMESPDTTLMGEVQAALPEGEHAFTQTQTQHREAISSAVLLSAGDCVTFQQPWQNNRKRIPRLMMLWKRHDSDAG